MRIFTINLKCLYICHMFIEFYLLYLPAEVAASRVQTFTSKKLDVNAHFEKIFGFVLLQFRPPRSVRSAEPDEVGACCSAWQGPRQPASSSAGGREGPGGGSQKRNKNIFQQVFGNRRRQCCGEGYQEHNKSIILDAQDALSRWRRE